MFRDDEFKETGTGSNEFEKQNLTGKNYEPKDANTPLRVLTATSIIGDTVDNFKGEKLGEIKNIMVNVHSGCIEYAVLEFGGFLGIGEKLFAIPFKSFEVDEDKRSFRINIDKEFLKKAPGFDKDHWPETNSKHWEDVGAYWSTYTGPYYPNGPII